MRKSLPTILKITHVVIFLMSLENFSFAAEGKKAAASKAKTSTPKSFHVDPKLCSTLLVPETVAQQAIAGTEEYAVEYPFSKLPDLIKEHPLLLMNADQKQLAVLNNFGYRRVLDPVYKHQYYNVPKVYHDALPATDGLFLVGQYEASSSLAKIISEAAQGMRGSKGPLLKGPPGTGKTVLEYVIRHALAHLSVQDPLFKEYTYFWKNLDMIKQADPSLGQRLDQFLVKDSDRLNVTSLQRSPFSLLPTELKVAYAKTLGASASKMLGFDIGDFYERNPGQAVARDSHAEDILREFLIPFYKKHILKATKATSLTVADYLAIFENFVGIARKDISIASNRDPIIRPMEEAPDTSSLIGTANVAARIKGANNTLGFHFNGPLSQNDGSMIIWDDVTRNDPVVLHFLLSVLQEGIAKGSDTPALAMDTFNVFSANYSSIADSKKRMDTDALLSRLQHIAMKNLLHPRWRELALLLTLKPNNFSARKLDSTEYKNLATLVQSSNSPLIKEIYAEPDSNGNLSGPEGHYAVRVKIDSPAEISTSKSSFVDISPYSLYFLGCIAAGSSLETNIDKLKDANILTRITRPDLRWFTDPIDRLRIITGDEVVENQEVLAALTEFSKEALLNEGDNGIGQRDIEVVFKKALELAQSPGHSNTLTPVEIKDAFRLTLHENQFQKERPEYAKWLELAERIAAELILPKLMNDVNSIIANDTNKVRSIYDAVTSEISHLAQDSKATHHTKAKGDIPTAINFERLAEIKKAFRKRWGDDLNPPDLQAYVANLALQNTDGSPLPMWIKLEKAISDWLMSQNLKTNSYQSLLDFMQGRSVATETQTAGQKILSNLERFGYNERSFVQALRFLVEHVNKHDKK
jgi:predicted Ser/Thr protein kinase